MHVYLEKRFTIHIVYIYVFNGYYILTQHYMFNIHVNHFLKKRHAWFQFEGSWVKLLSQYISTSRYVLVCTWNTLFRFTSWKNRYISYTSYTCIKKYMIKKYTLHEYHWNRLFILYNYKWSTSRLSVFSISLAFSESIVFRD